MSACQRCHFETCPNEGAIVVEGRYLCLDCRWARTLARRSERTERCAEPGCLKTTEEHIQEALRI